MNKHVLILVSTDEFQTIIIDYVNVCLKYQEPRKSASSPQEKPPIKIWKRIKLYLPTGNACTSYIRYLAINAFKPGDIQIALIYLFLPIIVKELKNVILNLASFIYKKLNPITNEPKRQ